MVAPLVLAGIFLAAAAIDSMYNVYSSHESKNAANKANSYIADYTNGAMAENSRYFEDYIRKHHLSGRDIKYPYRTGMNYNASALYGAEYSNRLADLNLYGSYVHGGTSIARAGAGGYYMANRMYRPGKNSNINDVMYG